MKCIEDILNFEMKYLNFFIIEFQINFYVLVIFKANINKAEHVQTSKPRANALKPIKYFIQPPKFKKKAIATQLLQK